MSRLEHQDMFPLERCEQCDLDSKLYQSLRGKYIHRCPNCFGTWVTPGSQMALINAIRGPIDFDIPVREILKEKLRG